MKLQHEPATVVISSGEAREYNLAGDATGDLTAFEPYELVAYMLDVAGVDVVYLDARLLKLTPREAMHVALIFRVPVVEFPQFVLALPAGIMHGLAAERELHREQIMIARMEHATTVLRSQEKADDEVATAAIVNESAAPTRRRHRRTQTTADPVEMVPTDTSVPNLTVHAHPAPRDNVPHEQPA